MKALTFILLSLLASCALGQRPNYCGIDINNPPAPPSYNQPPSGYSLQLVQALTRHGARLPVDTCWSNENVWDCGSLYIEERSIPAPVPANPISFENVTRLHRKRYIDGIEVIPGACMEGQLTWYGYNQHLVNGGNLKRTYGGSSVLAPNLSPSQIALRSTDVPRTLQSAQALIRGIYPWGDGSTSKNTTQLLDVFTVDLAREYLLPNPATCPLLAKYQAQATTSIAFQSYVSTVVDPLIAQMAPYFGLPVDQMMNIVGSFDCLSVHKCHGYPVPGNLPDSLYEQNVQAVEWMTKYIYDWPNPQAFGRLAMGQLYFELYSQLINAMEPGYSGPRFRLYSGHDTSVMPFLNAIGAWDGRWAPFAALLQMELWTSSSPSSVPLVRWIYNRSPLTLNGCGGEFCPFNLFTKLVEPILLRDPTDECLPSFKRPKLHMGTLSVDL